MEPRLSRLRRRLSYANVMATLAFFFALTGASMAGVKYITATDTIAASSDLAGSTYGNPSIAAGKVTTGKIADAAITSAKFDPGALAPNSVLLNGHTVAEFPQIIGRGSFSQPSGTLTLSPGGCFGLFHPQQAPAGTDPATDSYVIQPGADTDPSVEALGRWYQAPGSANAVPLVEFCNLGSVSSTVPGTYRYMFVR